MFYSLTLRKHSIQQYHTKYYLLSLSSLGIKRNIFNWIRVFLSNRKQCVINTIAGEKSERCCQWCSSGISFVFMLQTTCLVMCDCSVRMFADDSNVTQGFLHTVHGSCILTPRKIKLCIQVARILLTRTTCKLMAMLQNCVTSEVDLGVNFQSSPIYLLQIMVNTSVLRQIELWVSQLIKYTFQGTDSEMFSLLYKSLVPYIQVLHTVSGVGVCGPHTKTDMRYVQLELIQKWATKVSGIQHLPYTEVSIFLCCNWHFFISVNADYVTI